MEQQPKMPPQAPPPSKGMSRGCLIGLIALGVIVVLVILAGITCYVYKDELGKSAAVYLINEIKSEVAVDPPQGIDTTKFNYVVDTFMKRLRDDSLQIERLGVFFQTIQTIPEDKQVDSAEVELLIEAIVTYYPGLEEITEGGVTSRSDTVVPADTLEQ